MERVEKYRNFEIGIRANNDLNLSEILTGGCDIFTILDIKGRNIHRVEEIPTNSRGKLIMGARGSYGQIAMGDDQWAVPLFQIIAKNPQELDLEEKDAERITWYLAGAFYQYEISNYVGIYLEGDCGLALESEAIDLAKHFIDQNYTDLAQRSIRDYEYEIDELQRQIDVLKEGK